MKTAMHPASKGTRSEPVKVREIVAACFATHGADNAKRADERDRINRRVEQGRGKTFAIAGDKPDQCVTRMCDGRVGKQSAYVRLRKRHEVANHDR